MFSKMIRRAKGRYSTAFFVRYPKILESWSLVGPSHSSMGPSSSCISSTHSRYAATRKAVFWGK